MPANKPSAARLFREGVARFNAGRFFAAHESWEVIWLRASEPYKMFLQGITQISAAFHHFRRGNREGARSLLRKGLSKLERFPPGYRGVRLEALRRKLRVWRNVLQRRSLPRTLRIPKIILIPRKEQFGSPKRTMRRAAGARRK